MQKFLNAPTNPSIRKHFTIFKTTLAHQSEILSRLHAELSPTGDSHLGFSSLHLIPFDQLDSEISQRSNNCRMVPAGSAATLCETELKLRHYDEIIIDISSESDSLTLSRFSLPPIKINSNWIPK